MPVPPSTTHHATTHHATTHHATAHHATAHHATTRHPASHHGHPAGDALASALGWGLLLGVVAIVVAYKLSLRPKLIDGRWRVIDPQDGIVRTLIAAWIVLLGTRMFFGILVHDVLPGGSGAIGAFCFAAILYGAIWWWQGRRLWEAAVASPGELWVDDWPLAAGEHVTITYKRKLRHARPAGKVDATMRLWSKVHGHDWDGKHGRDRLVLEKEWKLTYGEAKFEGNELVATWKLQVPNPDGHPHRVLATMAWDLVSGQHRSYEGWTLDVELPLQGGGCLDSRYALDITFVPGRTQLHLGA